MMGKLKDLVLLAFVCNASPDRPTIATWMFSDLKELFGRVYIACRALGISPSEDEIRSAFQIELAAGTIVHKHNSGWRGHEDSYTIPILEQSGTNRLRGAISNPAHAPALEALCLISRSELRSSVNEIAAVLRQFDPGFPLTRDVVKEGIRQALLEPWLEQEATELHGILSSLRLAR